MLKKYATYNFLFGLLVLGAILLQSLHAIHHLVEAKNEKKCIHKNTTNKTELTHAHDAFEHCFACEFTLSIYKENESFALNHLKTLIPIEKTFFSKQEAANFFCGCLFSLRGPPSLK